MVGIIEAIANPVKAYESLVYSCEAGLAQYRANGPSFEGWLQCIDNLNPIAEIGRQFSASLNTTSVAESGQAFGTALTGSALTIAPFAKFPTPHFLEACEPGGPVVPPTGQARFVVSSDGIIADLVGQKNSISIGHYPEYVLNAEANGARTFGMADDASEAMSPTEQWLRNKRFLDDAVTQGSEIQLATPIAEVRMGSFLEKEISYLSGRGYVPNAVGTLMFPGGR